MYSILDIDLDYFNQVPDAAHRLEQLLNWAACPVSMVVECHNHAFARWRKRWRTHAIAPSHILHVDEHHDMMDQRQQSNIANFMFHAMCTWPKLPGTLVGNLAFFPPQKVKDTDSKLQVEIRSSTIYTRFHFSSLIIRFSKPVQKNIYTLNKGV